MVVVTLQKQVGCFSHRVVTLVAHKLERQAGGTVVYFGWRLINPEGSCPCSSSYNCNTLTTHAQNICEHCKNKSVVLTAELLP